MSKFIKLSHNVWSNPSVRNAVILGVGSFSIDVLLHGVLDLLYSGDSLRNLPDTFGLSVNFRMFLSTVVLTPLIETLIFQTLILHFLKWIKIGVRTSVFVSAIFFSYAHFEPAELSFDLLIQMMPISITGILFAAFYVNVWAKLGWSKAFWYLSLVHAVHNFIVILLLLILEQLAATGLLGPS